MFSCFSPSCRRSVNHALTDRDVTSRGVLKATCDSLDTFVSSGLPAVNSLIIFLWIFRLFRVLSFLSTLHPRCAPRWCWCCDIVALVFLLIFMASSCHFHNVAFDTFPFGSYYLTLYTAYLKHVAFIIVIINFCLFEWHFSLSTVDCQQTLARHLLYFSPNNLDDSYNVAVELLAKSHGKRGQFEVDFYPYQLSISQLS